MTPNTQDAVNRLLSNAAEAALCASRCLPRDARHYTLVAKHYSNQLSATENK